jgi:hypothetical protein
MAFRAQPRLPPNASAREIFFAAPRFAGAAAVDEGERLERGGTPSIAPLALPGECQALPVRPVHVYSIGFGSEGNGSLDPPGCFARLRGRPRPRL